MDLGKIIIEAMKESKDSKYGEIIANIKKLDFLIAQGLKTERGFEVLKKIDFESRVIENTVKIYMLGVVQDDKELRIEALKGIKRIGESLPAFLKDFRKYWNEHGKECASKDGSCHKHD